MAVLALTEASLPFNDAPGLTRQCINTHFTLVRRFSTGFASGPRLDVKRRAKAGPKLFIVQK